ncbi:hypothetical protein JT104_01235 [Helicobacter pylori]|nr:hypothetical protein [Helicobacter pylori]
MKIKAIMLGLAVSGALLFGSGASLENREQQIDRLEINSLDPQYIKLLAKKIMETNHIVGLNARAILAGGKAFRQQDSEIQLLKGQVERMEAELKVLHDQLVDLVAKQH